MAGGAGVLRGVAVGGRVAASDVSAAQAEPEVNPPHAGLQALFTPGRAGGNGIETFLTITNTGSQSVLAHVAFSNGDATSSRYCYECDFDVPLTGLELLLYWYAPRAVVEALPIETEMVWLAFAPTWNCAAENDPSRTFWPLNCVVVEIRFNSARSCPTSR